MEDSWLEMAYEDRTWLPDEYDPDLEPTECEYCGEYLAYGELCDCEYTWTPLYGEERRWYNAR